MRIRPAAPADADDVAGLAALFRDGLEAGAALNFTRVPDLAELEAWWRAFLADEAVTCWVAEDADGIAGTVSLKEALADNGPHRAEVLKLIVHRRARGQRMSTRLLETLEAAAADRGRTLLVLDTETDSPAEAIYRHLGWSEAGRIPGFAVSQDGSLHGTTLFFKQLDAAVAR